MSSSVQVIRVAGTQTGSQVVNVGAAPTPTPPPSGAAVTPYVHQQPDAADTWVVEHGLGRRPVAWQLYDLTGAERSQYRVEHLSLTRLRVLMDEPTAGTFETF